MIIEFFKLGKIERKQPFLSIRLPKLLWNTRFQKQLEQNKYKLITSFDIFKTLKHFLYLNKYGMDRIENDNCRSYFTQSIQSIRNKRGISLFENIPINRSCADALINEKECSCKIPTQELNNEQFQKYTKFTFKELQQYLVEYLQKKTDKYRNLCSVYKFDKLISVKMLIQNEKDKNSIRFQIDLIVQPDNSRFEFYIKFDFKNANKNSKINETFQIIDTLRLSIYGSTGDCIKKIDISLIIYCFCTNKKINKKNTYKL